VHFLHLRSGNPDALPLLLLHGWPGSIVEFRSMLGPLAEDFHLVVPSLPGFGFSGPTGERGWDLDRIARALAELMTRLGYPRFGAHGGDWGSGVARGLGAVAPDRVVGVHVNYLPTPGPADGLTGEDLRRAERIAAYAANRPGYQVLHATRPQTISYALTDSPVGQLAWIAEKFTEWIDPASTIDDDVLLTDVSIYWLTRTAGSSARLAKEGNFGPPCPVPMGVAVLPHDIVLSVRPLAERRFDIRHWTELPHGGHFAALEAPAELAADIRAFFRLPALVDRAGRAK
jgi:pimeloyl-ACP methyl ester carboxylesterase